MCVSCVHGEGVRACYDEGKRVAETLFFDFHRQHKIEVRVARIFNTFGPGMHPYGEKGREVLCLAGSRLPVYRTCMLLYVHTKQGTRRVRVVFLEACEEGVASRSRPRRVDKSWWSGEVGGCAR